MGLSPAAKQRRMNVIRAQAWRKDENDGDKEKGSHLSDFLCRPFAFDAGADDR
jgi:hypothetical protein